MILFILLVNLLSEDHRALQNLLTGLQHIFTTVLIFQLQKYSRRINDLRSQERFSLPKQTT